MSLRDYFDRASILARREGLPFTARDKSLMVSVNKIRHHLMLDGDNLKQKMHFTYRIDFGLRVNPNMRPAETFGFESKPTLNIVLRNKPEFGAPLEDDKIYEQYVSASQSIIVTDYKKAIARHGFAVMIHDNITNLDALPMVFGLHGSYNKDGLLSVRRLALPVFDSEGKVTGLQDTAVTKDNIEQALTYARLCAKQVFSKERLTPRKNWQQAIAITRSTDQTVPPPAPG